jgi:hypothetical protein
MQATRLARALTAVAATVTTLLALPALSPAAPPLVTTDGADVSDTTATLEGRVNPQGAAVTDCHFEYGTTTEYGAIAPCSPASLGSGSADVPVTAQTQTIEAGTTYHFRLVASRPGESAHGLDQIFTTTGSAVCPNWERRLEQGIATILLPACMALEMVSPAKKGNQLASLPSPISADGTRLVFNSIAALDPEVPNNNGITGDLFLASRGNSAWAIEGANLRYGDGFGEPQFSFSPDLSHWLQVVRDSEGDLRFFREGLGHTFIALSPTLLNLTGTSGPGFQGASADQSHVYFKAQGADPRTGTYLSDDPLPKGQGEDSNAYVAYLDVNSQPALELLARDRDGKAWGGNCGARLGGIESTTGLNLNLRNGQRNQGAISADGSRVYFSTRPGQPASGDCTEANKKRIMVREETPTGPVIAELLTSECTRVGPPACSAVDGDDAYQGASIDQSKVYFTTTRQLDDSDLDSGAAFCDISTAVAGCDLYLYDTAKPLGERLTQVSAGEDVAGQHEAGKEAKLYNSIAAISADGSRVYFTAQGALTADLSPTGASAAAGQPNLYTWDADSEELDFIGTLNSEDAGSGNGLWGSNNGTWNNGAYPVPIKGVNPLAGGDGHILLFKSNAPLTADDSDGAFTDLFRYDAEAGTIERISKGQAGGLDNGAFAVIAGGFGSAGRPPGSDFAEAGRPISEDGQTIELTTTEGLLPGDANGVEDVYLWRNGKLHRLPRSTRVPNTASNRPALSGDGSTVAYHTTAQLVPFDGDTAMDVYVARVSGGHQAPLPPIICEGENCQGDIQAPPSDQGADSESVIVPDNLHPKFFCPKGKVRRHGKCVKKKHHRKATHKKHHKRHAGTEGRAGK